MALTGNVKIPGLGEIPKKQAAAGAAVLAVILGVVWYRHRAAAAAANTPPAAAAGDASAGLTSDPYPPDGTIGDASDPNSTDPATGETYGDESPGYYGSSGVAGGGGGSLAQQVTSNAAWSQAAQAYLVTADPTVDPGTIASALGAYVTGSPVTADQQSIIEQAIAFEGYPPVAGPSGQPPSINLAPGGPSTTTPPPSSSTPPPGATTPPPSSGTPPAAATVTVPSVVNQQVNVAITTLQALGLTYKLSTVRNDKDTYIVNSQTPGAGTKVAHGSNVDLGIAPHTFPGE